MCETTKKIETGLITSFIDKSVISDNEYRSELLFNDYKKGIKVFCDIQHELQTCDEYIISVAFIKRSHLLENLLMILKEVDNKGVKGKILTTDYLNCTDPKALSSLHSLKNLEIRMFRTNEAKIGFHTKGYIFKHGDIYHTIIGSSNLTRNAQETNIEWNTKIITTKKGEYINSILTEFNKYWTHENSYKYDDFYLKYCNEIQKQNELNKFARNLIKKIGINFDDNVSENIIDEIIYNTNINKNGNSIFENIKSSVLKILDKKEAAEINVGNLVNIFEKVSAESAKIDIINEQKLVAKNDQLISYNKSKFEPNSMQKEFISNLSALISKGKNKALLISATGTGKTYASAFAVRELKAKKMLFIVHNEKIDRQALDSYRNVFSDKTKFGIISGNSKDFDADFIFATMQTVTKDENLSKFDKNYFDIIIVDEAHHVLANSYKRILGYFRPRQLLLGMTATPERSDGDIYSVFDHNIAYEIRLQDALEENMLCPFHYFGITDLKINGVDISENTEMNFNSIEYSKRVDYVLEQSEYYGYSGNRLKGLIFVSRIEEGKIITDIINKKKYEDRKYRARFIGGEIPETKVDETIKMLINDEDDKFIDFIVTVNKFNEGIDIRDVNQIIMLRPTESIIVFTQQLGRGLRKFENKEFTVVLDFIGNYSNNFMIPMALNGDRTCNKDNIRRYVTEGSKIIPGESSIQFDAISKKRIYDSIDKNNFSKMILLKEKYYNLKYKLGKVPTLMDFEKYGEIDPLILFESKKCYYEFKKSVDKDFNVELNERQVNVLRFISLELCDGKRNYEIKVLYNILNNKNIFEHIDNINEDVINSIYAVLSNQFYRNKYKNCDILLKTKKGKIEINSSFIKLLSKNFIEELKDVIELSLYKSKNEYNNSNDFVLNMKYSRKDCCRLINHLTNDESVIYGYRTIKNITLIFVTLKKKENITSLTNYKDGFENRNIFNWQSRHNKTLDSTEINNLVNSKKILLFVKKHDAEQEDGFYYLGNMSILEKSDSEILDDKKNKYEPIVDVKFKLDNSVREDIYDYLTRD